MTDLTNERWAAVEGFEGLYEVSDFGRVRSITRLVRFGRRNRLVTSRILAPSETEAGYPQVMLCAGKRVEVKRIHRLVAAAFVAGKGEVVRHLDGNSRNPHYSNLSWGTFSQNEADKDRHGRVRRGISNERAVLDIEKVRLIRELHKSGLSQLAISRATGIKRGVIGTVVRKERYADVN